jgi:hypothetical protein
MRKGQGTMTEQQGTTPTSVEHWQQSVAVRRGAARAAEWATVTLNRNE